MSNLPRVYGFNEYEFRSIIVSGEPWFVSSDVCRLLGISNPSAAAFRLDDDERGVASIDTLGGSQSMGIVNESGLYSLIMTSRKPEAKAFKKWVTSVVLPEIRKTGQYIPAPENPLLQLANAVLTAQKVIDDQSNRLAIAEPKAIAFDLISEAEGELCLTDAAKHLQIKPSLFIKWLQVNGWIFKRAGSKSWAAYQNRIDQGLLIHKRATFTRTSGEDDYSWQALVTPKGISVLAKKQSIQEFRA